MKTRKLLWCVLFVIIVVAFIIVIVTSSHQEKKESDNGRFGAVNNASSLENVESVTIRSENEDVIYQVYEENDGVLYSLDGSKPSADVVLQDKFFDTTIRDMNLNPDDYVGKKIQIDGLYFYNGYYSFVGRYSTSSLCPSCPPGYSFMEIHLNGKIDKKFIPESDWIKVVGIFKVGNDESSNYKDYYYLDVLSLELMNEKGNDTVSD